MAGSGITPRFPSPLEAGPDGLLLVTGALDPAWMPVAYQSGIFPMPLRHLGRWVIGWFSPDPRGVIELDEYYVNSRLARRMRNGEFTFSFDQAFGDVVAGCAAPRDNDTDIWITQAMQHAYGEMHRRGIAHSVEVWHAGELVGGVFGLAFGRFFAGESMFSRRTDASKAALAQLIDRLTTSGCELFDVQWTNDHTLSLGASDIRRVEYLERLASAIQSPPMF